MAEKSGLKVSDPVVEARLPGRKHYRELQWKNILRLVLTYLAPMALVTVYFYLQYRSIMLESQRMHLKAIAEHHASMLDLFLEERLVNLSNIIRDPKFPIPPSPEAMKRFLERLKKDSDTFIDLGYFDNYGVQQLYAGPFPSLEKKNYAGEDWWQTLKSGDKEYIITDIYLGFRQKPHFTIALKRTEENGSVVLRATLDPEKFYHFISSLERSEDVVTSLIDNEGNYQLVKEGRGKLLDKSPFSPPEETKISAARVDLDGHKTDYAYAWLGKAKWVVIVYSAADRSSALVSWRQWRVAFFAIVVMLIIFAVILFRAKKLVQFQIESDTTRIQLEHASKLASVGELAAGIAHEINNPLAIINEQLGLMKDMMNPEFGMNIGFDDLKPHIAIIEKAVFRGRDITRKLLSFVRKDSIDYHPLNVHDLIDDIVDGFLEREMVASNIKLWKKYGENIPQITSDGNQLRQVMLNLLNNAYDAITPPGVITIATELREDGIAIIVQDSGCGISPDKLEKIFLPFYTTKEVGKGTGLGLSVSYSIVKNMGGKMEVESTVGKGSAFTIILPVND